MIMTLGRYDFDEYDRRMPASILRIFRLFRRQHSSLLLSDRTLWDGHLERLFSEFVLGRLWSIKKPLGGDIVASWLFGIVGLGKMGLGGRFVYYNPTDIWHSLDDDDDDDDDMTDMRIGSVNVYVV